MDALVINDRYPHHRCAIACQKSLQELGFRVEICKPTDVKRGRGICDIAFYFIHKLPKIPRLYKGKINVLCESEQLPRADGRQNEFTNKRWDELRGRIAHFDYVFNMSSTNVEFISKQGYRAVYCPWGYTPAYGKRIDVAHKDIDVSFIGSLTPYRQKIIEQLGKVNLQVYNSVYGQKAIEIVCRSKVNLNIHNNNLGIFESERVVCMCMSNGAFAITQTYEDVVPLKNGEHLVCANVDEMTDKIRYYLDNEAERSKIAQQGYEFIKGHYTMTQNLEKALGQIKEIK